jgi:hypothetical protein
VLVSYTSTGAGRWNTFPPSLATEWATGLQPMLGVDEVVDQRRGGRKGDAAFVPSGRHRQPGQQMGKSNAQSRRATKDSSRER